MSWNRYSDDDSGSSYSEDEGYTCQICGKFCETWNAMRVHMLSQAHKARTVRCPTCPRMFKTPADMCKHLEQGTCGNHTRSSITSAIRSWEASSGNHNLLTVKCIEWKEESAANTRARYKATQGSFNGVYFECPMCFSEFDKLYKLNQHLNSPAHDPENYHCRNCGIKYKLLSSLISHFESGKCGAMSYRTVTEMTNAAVSHLRGMRL